MRGSLCESSPRGHTWNSLWGTIRVKVCRNGRRGAMRTVTLAPYVELPGGHDPCEGRLKIVVGTPCVKPAFSLGPYVALPGGDTIHVKSAPKWTGEAMRSRLAPFPSSIPPPSTRPCPSLLSSLLPAVSSLLPLSSSLFVPLSSLLLFAEETRWHLRPAAWVPRDLSLGSPSLGSLSSRGSWGSIGSLHCVALYCTALFSVARACVLLRASRCLGSHCSTLP